MPSSAFFALPPSDGRPSPSRATKTMRAAYRLAVHVRGRKVGLVLAAMKKQDLVAKGRVAVFARVPASAGKKLATTALELGRPKQEVIAELVDRYAGMLGEEFSIGRATIANDPPEVLTPEELAALLQIDITTVLALATTREIPGRELNGEWRFSRTAVLAWLADDH